MSPDCRGEHSGEGQAADSSPAPAAVAVAVEQHCARDRCLAGVEGRWREKGVTWAKREMVKRG